jgi:hypothetical protein
MFATLSVFGAALAVAACAAPSSDAQAKRGSEATGMTSSAITFEGGTLRVNNDMCLYNPQGAQATYGTPLEIKHCNADDPNQQWYMFSEGTIRPVSNPDVCVDLPAWTFTDGTPIGLWGCNGGTNQQWSLNADGTIRGYVGLEQDGSKAPPSCLDDPDFSHNDGDVVDYWHCKGPGEDTSNQRFVFAGCETAPSNCAAWAPGPNQIAGDVQISCAGYGTGRYTVEFSRAVGAPPDTSWFLYPDQKTQAEDQGGFDKNGQKLDFGLDEDNAGWPHCGAPPIGDYSNCTFRPNWVRICANPGAAPYTHQTGMCDGASRCVTVAVQQQ